MASTVKAAPVTVVPRSEMKALYHKAEREHWSRQKLKSMRGQFLRMSPEERKAFLGKSQANKQNPQKVTQVTRVTREEMEELRALKVEIEVLAEIKPRPQLVPIFYKDYSTGKGIPKTDVGLDDGREEAEALAAKIEKKRRAQLRLVKKLEDFLDGIEDPETRTTLRLYYVEGLPQREVAERLGVERSTIAKRLGAFWTRLQA